MKRVIKRILQKQHGSIVVVVPRTFTDVLGLEAGDEVSFDLINNGKIIIAPIDKPPSNAIGVMQQNTVVKCAC